MANELCDARLSTETELKGWTGEGKGDVYLGHYYDEKTDTAGDETRYRDDRHILVLGPTGSGKTKRFLVPTLTTGLEDQSVIVIDPKGELAAMTADHRRSLGHDVLILNPFNVLGMESVGFNPMSSLDPSSPHFYDDAAALGDALIQIEGKDPHWTQSAQGLIVALLMWEKRQRGDKANLENVRRMLTERDEWEEATGSNGKPFNRQTAGLRVTAAKMTLDGGYEIASLAQRFTGYTDELSSIRSAADTQTRWLLSPMMRADVGKNGIDFGRLKDKPTTVYVVLPAERLRTHNVWLRLVIVSALRALYRPGKVRTLFLIDEMAALGQLGPLEDAIGLVRGYAVQIAAIFQDLPQLKALYSERWETFIANAGAVLAFAPNDLTTADWMSRRSGQTTVVVKGFTQNTGTSTGGQTSTSQGSSSSDQQIARNLYLPHELIGFGRGMGMLWLAGLQHGSRFFAPYYAQIKACRERTKPSPYDEG